MDATTLRKAADTIRILSAEAIQKAKSGHPGMPMGNADFAMVLWAKYLRHNPADPTWMRIVSAALRRVVASISFPFVGEIGFMLKEKRSSQKIPRFSEKAIPIPKKTGILSVVSRFFPCRGCPRPIRVVETAGTLFSFFFGIGVDFSAF